MIFNPRRDWLFVLLLLGGISCGCAKSLHRIEVARDAFGRGDLELADKTLRELSQQADRYADSASLDLAMVELASGQPVAAERRLRDLRDRFETLPNLDPLHESAAMATDDTARLFRPAGYEEVMIRSMLAICSLANDQFDAESYALQAMHKQSELAREAEERGRLELAGAYQPIAIAPYLRGILREATHRDYDDATRAYQLVSSVRPQFAPAKDDISRAIGGTHSAPGHGVLYVIAFVGRGPVLKETVEPTTTVALQIASVLLNAATNQEGQSDESNESTTRETEFVLPNIAAVKIPKVFLPPNRIDAVEVSVDGRSCGATQTLTDVGELASNQCEAEMPWTIARSVVRRVGKELAVAKLGDSLGLEGDAGSIFHFAASSTWSGMEKTDTRCWGLLPRKIQVLRAELPSGSHQLSLKPLGLHLDPRALEKRVTVEIADGTNRYLVVIASDDAFYLVH